MIIGEWSPSGEAAVRLTVRGPAGERYIRAVIDTGFDGWLSLPPEEIQRLGLPQVAGAVEVELADGRVQITRLFKAVVLWDDEPRQVIVDEAPTEPLLGTELLKGHELRIHYTEGGRVEIEAMP